MNRHGITRIATIAALLASQSAGFAGAQETEKKWKNETEASVVSTNGNSKATTSSAKNKFSYRWTLTTLDIEAGALGSRSEGTTTAEKYFANEKLSYKLTDRTYAFEKVGWEKDRFTGIRNRYDGNLGLGREMLNLPKDKLIAELGGGYVSEERVNARRNDFASGRAYAKYTHVISDTANFTQDAEYLANFEDPDDFRVNTETAIIANLSRHFSLKASYLWKHVGQPPAGFGRNDTTTSVALIAIY